MRKKAFWVLTIICIALCVFISCDGGFGENELKVSSYSNGKSKVTVLVIRVKADAVGKLYNAYTPVADPPLTYTYSPAPLPDGVFITGDLVRDPGEFAGTYVIRQGTLELTGPNASKYTLKFIGNRFSIYGL
ncbi:MAG: hypothetical protein IKT97_02995 [Spirochaetia bacterium]|nr:hypothetical protein [Spirochaetia bacterium]